MSQVTGNETVKLHYTGKLNNGQVFDSSLQREPLEIKRPSPNLAPNNIKRKQLGAIKPWLESACMESACRKTASRKVTT